MTPERVLMIGHFPPPVHGMAVAFSRLADIVERRVPVVRIRTSPDSLTESVHYHAVRVGRVLLAASRLVACRPRARTVLLSVDAGVGMAYVVLLTLAARLLRYRIYLQHHSYAYLDRTAPLMRLLAAVAGPSTHLCSCPIMTSALKSGYRTVRHAQTLPLAYAVTQPAELARLPRAATEPLRIGHFGNLTMAKGLDVVLRTAARLRESDCHVQLHLAGPLGGPEEEQLIARAGDEHVTYYGPVYGADRDDFLAGIDVLLFPSRYGHESFGLALWESLAAGIPAIAYRAGCLTPAATGDAAVVLEPGADFVTEALSQLRRWDADRAALAAVQESARLLAQSQITAGERAATRFATSLAGS